MYLHHFAMTYPSLDEYFHRNEDTAAKIRIRFQDPYKTEQSFVSRPKHCERSDVYGILQKYRS